MKEVPDAELYVIGSGRLYDKNSKLGKFGLAEDSYEQQFMQYLCVDEQILPSVHFMGDMGIEKNDILLKTKVGVPNPSGITETFCISAVEMQAMGAMVTTINFPGFIDTVNNGCLYKHRNDLSKSVIDLLKNGNSCYDRAIKYIERNFSFESVVSKWEILLKSGNIERECKLYNKFYRLKWLKEIKRKAELKFTVLYKLPTIERISLFIERFLHGRITYIDS